MFSVPVSTTFYKDAVIANIKNCLYNIFKRLIEI